MRQYRWMACVAVVLLVVLGGTYLVLGGWLLSLGGSAYYLPAGVLLLVSAGLAIRRPRTALVVYSFSCWQQCYGPSGKCAGSALAG